MNKKKAIKVVAASAIAASAFAAVAPTQSQAATSVATTVTNAQKAMKAPFDKYYQTGTTKKTVSAATVQALITKGEKAYADATAVVKKSGGKSAKTYQAKLDGYKKYLDRSKAYVAGLGSIFKVYGNADAALKANKVADLEKAQAELKDPKNQGHVGIGKIYGPVVREVLTGAFDRLSKVRLDKIEAALEALATPKVDSVSAINASQILVKFNKSVDATTAADEANFVLSQSGGINVDSAVVQEDGKSVLLTTDAPFTTSTNAVLTVKDVVLADDDNKTFPLFTTTVTVNDTVKPEVTSVVSKTNGDAATSATITFSEPVVSGTIKVDGVSYGPVVAGKTQTLTGLSLAANATHTIEVVNLKDGANNVSSVASKTFSVTKDTVSPAVSSITPFSDSALLVTFSKAVSNVDGNIALKDEAYGDLTEGTVYALPGDTTGTKFVLPINEAGLYANKTVRNLTAVFAGNVIVDSLGNTLDAATKTVSITKDAAAPEVTGITYKKNADGNVTKILVNFNEGITAATLDADKITVVNENGVLQSGLLSDAVVASNGAKTAEFTLAAGPTALSGKYAFSVASGLATDLAATPNNSKAFSQTVDFGAAQNPTTTFDLTDATVPAGQNNVIKVDFGQAVKGGAVEGSATDASRYALNGRSLPAGTRIVLDGTQNVATITLPEGTITADDSDAIFTVNGVVTLTNKINKAYTTTLAIDDNTAPVLQTAALTSYDATAHTAELTLTFSEALAPLTAAIVDDELVIKNNNSNVAVTAATASSVAGYAKQVKVSVTGVTLDTAKSLSLTTVDVTGNDIVDASNLANELKGATTVTVSK
ncbi:hypothetical protein [Bacillus sp. MUM 13]|uniref:hypothetical protein n=1 Tax=Bacillus sp. MUM 13 TaxID=1678001 RepID=UPI0008F5C00B|nr:hypothetical protein [Bacillus sp. MUM 13]OIK10075.1 hypothetical protein BIV59_15175 [Bacillus sp. MUM 13]